MIKQLWQALKEIESEFGENTRLEIRVDDGSWVISELDIFSETTWRAVNSGNTLAELLVYSPKEVNDD